MAPAACRLAAPNRTKAVILAAVLCAAVSGCETKPKLYPVKGRVLFRDNSQPLPGGTILFEQAGDPPKRASGELDQDGAFTLGCSQGEGAWEGEYRIQLTNPPAEGNYVVPAKYQQFGTSGLTFKVVPGGENVCEIKIDRGGRR